MTQNFEDGRPVIVSSFMVGFLGPFSILITASWSYTCAYFLCRHCFASSSYCQGMVADS